MLKTFPGNIFFSARNYVLESTFWNSDGVCKLYFQYKKRISTPASDEVSIKTWIHTSYMPGRHEDGRKPNWTWLQVRKWWTSRILSEKSNSALDCEQLLSEFSPEGKVQHVKVMFKLTGVHWTISDKIYKQQKCFQVYSKSIQWGLTAYVTV